jgi:nicotinamidase-related amidase
MFINKYQHGKDKMKYTESVILEHANEAFKNGNASFTTSPEKSVLLVIDMQNEFVLPEWTSSWIPEATRQVEKIKEVIHKCREKNIPIIYTVFSKTYNYYDRPLTGEYMPNRFPELGNEQEWFTDGKIYSGLLPEKDDIIIHKPSYGAFYDTPLDTILKRLGKDTIIICGTLTNCCCGTTARQGYERGYKVIFGSDITSTYTREMQESELGILRFAFAKVMDSAEIINFLDEY